MLSSEPPPESPTPHSPRPTRSRPLHSSPIGETEAQMHPGITRFQTVLTSIGARRDVTYLVEVATVLCHMFLFSFLDAPGCSCLFSQGSQELLLMNPFEQEKTYRSPYVLCTCSTFVVYHLVCCLLLEKKKFKL